jgi:hypothetical protein
MLTSLKSTEGYNKDNTVPGYVKRYVGYPVDANAVPFSSNQRRILQKMSYSPPSRP